MTTMLRLAKRGEASYCNSPIYLDNENRKIVFAEKAAYASILAQDDQAAISKEGYRAHRTLEEAQEYRCEISSTRTVVTIDTQGYIYDTYFDLAGKLMLIKTNDMVALNPFGFLSNYKDIANSYAAILEFSSLAVQSELMTAENKAKAHQLKELAYKVITLFKHTHELSVQTCIEFNDDFFNPNPVYAEKTLARVREISSRLSELLTDEQVIGAEKIYNSAIKFMNIDSTPSDT